MQQAYEIYQVTNTPDLSRSDFEVLVYPNPVTDVLTIELQNTHEPLIFSYKIKNIQGKELATEKDKVQLDKFDFSNYTEGSYFIEVIIGTTIKTFKLIKKQ